MVKGADTGHGGGEGEDARQGSGGWTGQVRQWLTDRTVPHLYANKSEGTTGDPERPCNPGFLRGKIKTQNRWL